MQAKVIKELKVEKRSYLLPPQMNKWIKPVSQVLGSQLLLQALGFGLSIILVRTMPKQEYAVYTVLISIQGLLTVLSNSGLITGFMSIAGKIWTDEHKLSSLIKTAEYIRIRIIVLAFLVCAFYGTYVLYKQQVPYLQIGWLLLCLLLLISPEMNKALITKVLVLRKQLAVTQSVEVINQSLRFILIGLIFVFFQKFLIIQVVIIVTVISAWSSYSYLLKKTTRLRNLNPTQNAEYKKTLLHYVKLNWHNSAFYAFKGQISIFIIGIFGTLDNLANLGALSRFSLLFLLVNSLISNFLTPAFAREQNYARLLKQFFSTLILLLLFSAFILLVVAIFPQEILSILGSRYDGLDFELFLVFVSSLLGVFSGAVIGCNQAKGWMKYTPVLEIPCNIITLLIGLWIFDTSTLQGVLYLGILSVSTNLILYIFNSWAGFKQILR
jgi:O-antigen/teichoic acid export membrane protein